ncbi:MAG: hypothetical protein ACO23O_05795 [Ilumatobacteraceae bacterium]
MTESSERSPSGRRPAGGPRVVVGMGGGNLLVRTAPSIDRDDTVCLVDVINAAGETGTVVVVDPYPVPCDDLFAGEPLADDAADCPEHLECTPAAATVAGVGVVRLQAESAWWMLDVAAGRLCRTSRRVEPCFVPVDQWTEVVAVAVTPTRLRALTADGMVITRYRAHGHTVGATARRP